MDTNVPGPSDDWASDPNTPTELWDEMKDDVRYAEETLEQNQTNCVENSDCAIGFICVQSGGIMGGRCDRDTSDSDCGQPGCGGSEAPDECLGIQVVRPGSGAGIEQTSCGAPPSDEVIECRPFPINKCIEFCDSYHKLYGIYAGSCKEENVCGECGDCQNKECLPVAASCRCQGSKSPDGVVNGGPCYDCNVKTGAWELNEKRCKFCQSATVTEDCGCTKEPKAFTRELCQVLTTTDNAIEVNKRLRNLAKQKAEAAASEYCQQTPQNCFSRGLANYSPNLQGDFDAPPPTFNLFDITGWGPPSNGLAGYANAFGFDYSNDEGCPDCYTIPDSGGKKSLPPMNLTYNEADLDPSGVTLENLASLCPGDAQCVQSGDFQVGDSRGVIITVYPSQGQQNENGPDGEPKGTPQCDDPALVGRYVYAFKDSTPSFTYQLCTCRGGQNVETQPATTTYKLTQRFDALPITVENDPIISEEFPCAGVPNGNNAALMNTRCSSYTKVLSGEVVYLLYGDVCGPGKPNPQSDMIVKDGEGNTILATTYGSAATTYPYQDAVINFNRVGVTWDNPRLEPHEVLITGPVNPAYLPPTCFPVPKAVARADFQTGECAGDPEACAAIEQQYFGQVEYNDGAPFKAPGSCK